MLCLHGTLVRHSRALLLVFVVSLHAAATPRLRTLGPACALLLAQMTTARSEFVPAEPPSTPDNRSIVYMNQIQSNTLPAQRMSYMVRELLAAREEAASLPPESRGILISQRLKRARADIATIDFEGRSSPTGDIVSGTVSNLIGSAPVVGAVAGSVFDAWRDAKELDESRSDQQRKIARARAVPPNEVAIFNSHWDISGRNGPEDYLGMSEDMKIPGYHEDPKQDPEFQLAQRLDQFEDKQRALEQIVKQTSDRRARIEMMSRLIARHPRITPGMRAIIAREVNEFLGPAVDQVTATAAALEEATKTSEDAQREREKREAYERRRIERRENLASGFMAAQNLALILGDSETARLIGQAGVVGDSVFQITNFAKEEILAQPFKYANLYLLAASTLLNMFGPLPNAQVLNALKNLGKQLEDMRLEMRETLKQLDLKVDRYHLETKLDLERIAETQARIQNSLHEIERDIRRFHTDWTEATNQLASSQLEKLSGRCLGVNADGSPFFIDSRNLASDCLGMYTTVGSGSYSMLLQHESKAQTVEDTPSDSRRAFENLVERLGLSTRRDPVSFNAAENFELGATKLLEILDRNPNLIPMAKGMSWEGNKVKYTFDDLVRTGRNIVKFKETMALIPNESEDDQKGGGSLRVGIFQELLRDWRKTAGEVVLENGRLLESNLKGLPAPSIDWTKNSPPPLLESRSPLVKEGRVFVCGAEPLKLNPLDWPGSDKFKPEDLKQRRLRKVNEMASEGLELSPAYLDYLPPAVRWADLVEKDGRGIKPYRVHACLSRADVWFGYAYLWMKTELTLTLDFFVTDVTAPHAKPRLIAQLGGKDVFSVYDHDPADSPNVINSLWTKGRVRGEDRYSYGEVKIQLPNEFANLKDEPKRFFKPVGNPEISENLRQLESSVRERLESRSKETLETRRGSLAALLGKLSQIRWQIDHLMREGLDLRDPRLARLYDLMMRKALPTSDAFFREVEGAHPSRTLERLNADHAAVEELLLEISKADDLRPAVSPVSRTLARLEAVKNAPPRPLWRRMFDKL